ncbi:MAG: hypothetical protein RLZZ288_1638, partial [Planctomycetota bacterium]
MCRKARPSAWGSDDGVTSPVSPCWFTHDVAV